MASSRGETRTPRSIVLILLTTAAFTDGTSASKSDMHVGVEIPFETRCLATNPWKNTGLLPTVEVTIVGDDGTHLTPQRVLLDAGSSAIGFCNTSMQDYLKTHRTGLSQCERYAGGSGFESNVFQGPLGVGDTHMFGMNYSVMTIQREMPCYTGFQGIMGIGMSKGNNATLLPLPGDLTELCPKQDTRMKSVVEAADVEQIGIHWNVTDTGSIGSNVTNGMVYINEMAYTAPQYSESAAMKAQLDTSSGWYGINVTRISANLPDGTTKTITAEEGWFDCADGNCLFDTGNTKITLPMSARAQLFGCAAPSDSCKDVGTIAFELQGASGGPPISLQFNATELGKPWPVCSDAYSQLWDGGIPQAVTFGMPLWASFYTIVDIKKQQAIFVTKDAGVIWV